MKRTALFAAALAGVSFAFSAAAPLAAQSVPAQLPVVDLPGVGPVYVLPVQEAGTHAQGRLVNVPGYGLIYVVPVPPRDTRTAKQICLDEEIERAGGSPSRLDRRVIDLKCSQR